MPRDNQRSKVIKSEWRIEDGVTFDSIHDAREFVNKITRSHFWKQQYYRGVYISAKKACKTEFYKITVQDGRGRRNAYAYGTKRIALPKWARNAKVTLHELAHILVNSNNNKRGFEVPSHGREFVRAYLALIKRFAPELYEPLKAEYKKNRVKYRRQNNEELIY